jgi:hypothetical protein
MERTPKPGEIYYLTKDKPYQIITMGIHKETSERMVIYQALYGEYNTYVLPLSKFKLEVTPISTEQNQNSDTDTKPDAQQIRNVVDEASNIVEKDDEDSQDKVNQILLEFLDVDSYSKKLDIITSNTNEIDDRLINDMAASLDCTVDEGPMEQRLQGLLYCLKQLSRFEDKRLRSR